MLWLQRRTCRGTGRSVSARGFIAGAAITALVACGSAAMRAQTPATAPQTQTMPGTDDGSSPQDKQIAALAREIADSRAKLPEPTAAQMSGGANPTCVRNASAVCTQTCQLSDSICANSEKICDIASKLPADDWAATKCKDNKATCTTAATQCCECTP